MVDKEYWSGVHPRPLTPDDSDVEVYRSFISPGDSVLLLGNTRLLLPLCTAAMDTEPFVDDPRVIRQEWTTNIEIYDVIIGDGVLNFTHELANGLINMASRTCTTFVARSFNKRLDIMRVADNFPRSDSFLIPPTEEINKGLYSFFVWRFSQ